MMNLIIALIIVESIIKWVVIFFFADLENINIIKSKREFWIWLIPFYMILKKFIKFLKIWYNKLDNK